MFNLYDDVDLVDTLIAANTKAGVNLEEVVSGVAEEKEIIKRKRTKKAK